MIQKKMFQINAQSIISLIFLLVFSLSLTGENLNYVQKGPDVESIYQSIRHSSPEYEGIDEIVTFKNKGKTLVCTLTIPDNGKRAPIVIALAGFLGPRDEEPIPNTDETVFGRAASILAGFGIASLRVDFRGFGESDGEFYEASFSTQISDVIAAISYIKKELQDKVNSKSIGIVGFSQGGLVGSIAGAKDKRVDSIVLWSPVANPPATYGELLTKDGLLRGLNLPHGGTDSFGLYVAGQYVGLDLVLGKKFFEDIYKIDPVAEIRKYKKPLMVLSGKNDIIVTPQPQMGELFLRYHSGFNKLVRIDADHEFDYWDGPVAEKLSDAIYWTTAWFLKTLKR